MDIEEKTLSFRESSPIKLPTLKRLEPFSLLKGLGDKQLKELKSSRFSGEDDKTLPVKSD